MHTPISFSYRYVISQLLSKCLSNLLLSINPNGNDEFAVLLLVPVIQELLTHFLLESKSPVPT